MTNPRTQGCGGGNCQCAGVAQLPVPAINGIGLHEPGQCLDETELRARTLS